MRIIGIDPGLNITGYGVLERAGSAVRIIEAGVVRSGRGALERRIQEIFDGVNEVVQQHAPEEMAIEELYSHYGRPRTAILMGHARGVLCLAAAKANLPVFPYAATQVKSLLTGHGRAGKAQVQQAVARELSLATVPEPPDIADALAVAICHSHLRQNQQTLQL